MTTTQKKYRKLVRDRIPEIIRNNGGAPKIHTLGNLSFREELFKKLIEEAGEVRRANGIEELMTELADVEEVFLAILEAYKIDPKQLEKLRKKRARERGAFVGKTFLESVEAKSKTK